MNEVRIDPDLLTTIEVNKVGSEMGMNALESRDYDPLVECGSPAERAGDEGRTRRIQEKLNALGFDVGPPDGIVGNGTRGGMTAFLAANRIELESEAALLLEQHLDCVTREGKPFRRDASVVFVEEQMEPVR